MLTAVNISQISESHYVMCSFDLVEPGFAEQHITIPD